VLILADRTFPVILEITKKSKLLLKWLILYFIVSETLLLVDVFVWFIPATDALTFFGFDHLRKMLTDEIRL
jgi:hypothetical protein